MPEPAGRRAWPQVRALLLDDGPLVRAVASGRRHGASRRLAPGRAAARRPQGRPPPAGHGVRRRARRTPPTTPYGDAAAAAVDALLAEPFGNWHVETTTETAPAAGDQEGRGAGAPQRAARPAPTGVERPTAATTGRKPRLLAEDDPVLRALGIADAQGRIKPSRQAKYRQVEEFLRALDAGRRRRAARRTADRTRPAAGRRPRLRQRLPDLRRARATSTDVRGLPVAPRPASTSRRRPASTTAASPRQLGWSDRVRSSRRDRRTPPARRAPDVVLALHACDTATDDALARAVRWEAPLVLAAPCCHHDIAAPARRRRRAPAPYAAAHPARHPARAVRRHPHRRAARRAAAAASATASTSCEFVGSEHTPRNTLLRAVRTGRRANARRRSPSTPR